MRQEKLWILILFKLNLLNIFIFQGQFGNNIMN